MWGNKNQINKLEEENAELQRKIKEIDDRKLPSKLIFLERRKEMKKRTKEKEQKEREIKRNLEEINRLNEGPTKEECIEFLKLLMELGKYGYELFKDLLP